jgi:antitoxin component YwqK of YwqJK toxin-antitoxin module
METGYFLKNEKVGVWNEFDIEGKKIVESNYVDGVLNGELIRYKCCLLYLEENYVDGELNGKVTRYNPDGGIDTEGYFKDGEMVHMLLVKTPVPAMLCMVVIISLRPL